VIKGGRWKFIDGALKVPTGPGLGVELDYTALAELHDAYLEQTQIDRNDTEEIKRYIPDYVRQVPRW
jgi:glucarate dehydratase